MLAPLVLAALPLAFAQFPPPITGVKTLTSKYHEGVKISYKQPNICETTPNVKSYSGYVHLPPGLLSDIEGEDVNYPINTFFWFFESRKDPHNAPLSIWLNGGPGGSSLMGALQENGPCFVGDDSDSTYLNPYSWSNEVNMLYLDQPTHVGFSYDIPTNITWNTATDDKDSYGLYVADFSDGVPAQNNTFFVGTASSQKISSAPNTTVHAAHALWHFAQTWFSEFPKYKPNDDRVSLWTESYGGHYGPGIFKFFQQQNERIRNGTIKEDGTHYIHLDTLGIINGLLDDILQLPMYAEMAYNNTYGIQLINQTAYEKAMHDYYTAGGCRDQLSHCQQMALRDDPDWRGNVPDVTNCFVKLEETCFSVESVMDSSNWSWFDIAHPKQDPTPEPYMHGYLRHSHVLSALGVPVNFTYASPVIARAFDQTGDIQRAGSMEAVAYLLDSGVKVHLMYGDRDYACNWLGGEAASLGIKYSGSEAFRSAGYAPILGDEGLGGFVRQYGNFSFSRVFQAGHEVPYYAPATAYDIFHRAMFNRDIATGLIPTFDTLQTIGPASTFHVKNELPPKVEPRCYIYMPDSCTDEQFANVKDGTAIVKDGFVVGVEKDLTREASAQYLFGESSEL